MFIYFLIFPIYRNFTYIAPWQQEPLFVHPGISSRMVDGALCFSDTETPLRIQQFSIHSYVGQRCFAMGMLDKGVLQWKNRGGNRQKVQTAVSYKSESGKTCYKGTAALKKTEILGIGWAIVFHPFSYKIEIY